jgi:SAM-dependent methyltransferase
MSFFPLPTTLLEDLARFRGEPIVELGCGDGRLSAVLVAAGASLWRVDRRPPWAGSTADLVADARRLPFPAGRISLLICANLLRQLWPPRAGSPVPEEWRHCLRPGGVLFLLEDEPTASTPAAHNYRELQAFLARVAPQIRRPLLPRRRFLKRLRAEGELDDWRHGQARNDYPADAGEVASWLRSSAEAGGTGSGRSEPGRHEGIQLAEALERGGLGYGDYWWARWSSGERV